MGSLTIDNVSDMLIVFVGLCYLIMCILLAIETLFSLILTVPLTAVAVVWLRQADWDGFLQ